MRRGRLGSCSRSEKNITRGAQKIESTESTVSTFVPGEFSDLANPVSGFALRRGQKYAPRSDIAHIGAAKLWSAAPGRSGEGFDCQRPGAHHAAGLSSGGQKAPRNSHVAEKAEKVFRYRTIISRIASKWPRRGRKCAFKGAKAHFGAPGAVGARLLDGATRGSIVKDRGRIMRPVSPQADRNPRETAMCRKRRRKISAIGS